jgi:hypothetical protein
MKTHAWSVGILLAAVSVAFAAQGSPYEDLLKQAVEGYEKIGVTLKKIEDKASAEAARPDLRKAAASIIEARAKAEKLQQPEKDEKDRIVKLYKARLETAMKLVITQSLRVDNIPGGREALKEIAAVLKKDSKKN